MRLQKLNLIPPLAAIGLHAAAIGILIWFGTDQYNREEIVENSKPTTFVIQSHRPLPKEVVKSQQTAFTPQIVKPPARSLPPPPVPSVVLPLATKRIAVPFSNSRIQLPAPTSKTANTNPNKPSTTSKPATASKSQKEKAPPAENDGGYVNAGTVTYVRRSKPVYPAEALRKKLVGTAILMVYVNETGAVDNVEIIESSGIPSLDAAALTAERKSRFTPQTKNGKPVKFKARVPYRFQIQK